MLLRKTLLRSIVQQLLGRSVDQYNFLTLVGLLGPADGRKVLLMGLNFGHSTVAVARQCVRSNALDTRVSNNVLLRRRRHDNVGRRDIDWVLLGQIILLPLRLGQEQLLNRAILTLVLATVHRHYNVVVQNGRRPHAI